MSEHKYLTDEEIVGLYLSCPPVARPLRSDLAALRAELKAAREENERMRRALEDAPHAVDCCSRQEAHSPGFIHYETDAGERCPIYHYGKGECDCFKRALTPQTAQPEKA